LIETGDRMEMIEKLDSIFTREDLLKSQRLVNEVFASDSISNYILDILEYSRRESRFQDLSPRVGVDLMKASKSWAYLEGRDHVMPEDVQKIAPAVVGHRLAQSKESTVDLEMSLSKELLNNIPVY